MYCGNEYLPLSLHEHGVFGGVENGHHGGLSGIHLALSLESKNLLASSVGCKLPLQCDREQHIPRRLDLYDLRLRQDVITRTHPPAKLRLPPRDIPLQALGADHTGFLDGHDPHILIKHISLALPLPDVHAVPPRLEQERQRLPADQEHPTLRVRRVRLEEVQVVQLAEALVDAPAEPAHGDDVQRPGARRRVAADEADGFAEVGGFLVFVVDDTRRRRRRRPGGEVRPGRWGERVEVAYYYVEVVLVDGGWLDVRFKLYHTVVYVVPYECVICALLGLANVHQAVCAAIGCHFETSFSKKSAISFSAF